MHGPLLDEELFMWTHVLGAYVTGVALFVVPIILVAALAGTLAVLDRLFYRCTHITIRGGK